MFIEHEARAGFVVMDQSNVTLYVAYVGAELRAVALENLTMFKCPWKLCSIGFLKTCQIHQKVISTFEVQ